MTRGVEACEKRKRHSAVNVHPHLVKEAWVEVDRYPVPIEPEKFDLEDPKITELSAKAENRIRQHRVSWQRLETNPNADGLEALKHFR